MDSNNTAKNEVLINGLVAQAQQISEESTSIEVGEENPNADKKSSSFSKNMINVIFIAVFIFGIIGSFVSKQGYFDMDAYVKFIETFAYIWAPLVLAVGGGRAYKNYVTKKYK